MLEARQISKQLRPRPSADRGRLRGRARRDRRARRRERVGQVDAREDSGRARCPPTAARSRSTARRARSRSPRDALDVGIALVTQEPTACPSMSVAENLLLTRLPKALVAVPAPPLQRPRPAAPRGDRRRRRSCGAVLDSLKAGDRELVEVGKALATEPALPDPRRVDEPARRGRRRATLPAAAPAARRRHLDDPDHAPAARDHRARRPRGRAARRPERRRAAARPS